MVKFEKGNLLEANTQALVNTVNTMGVMGKGVALQFKEAFPHNYKNYIHAFKSGELKIGKMLVTKDHNLHGEYIIINFPTKTEWFKKSQYNYIEEGMKDFVKTIRHYEIKSVAMPPLGSGNGGLRWDKVKMIIKQYLEPINDVEFIIYEPNAAVKELLQKEEEKKETKLTPARAMLLYALYNYESLGDEAASVFAANKLAYFLQKSGENLRLQFTPYTYGPYAVGVEKVLYALNGKYLRGMEQMKIGAFEPLKLNYEKRKEVEEFVATQLTSEQKQRLNNLFTLIKGFESSLALEILASVHFLLDETPRLSEKEIFQKIQKWNERKKALIKEEYITKAIAHLKSYGSELHIN